MTLVVDRFTSVDALDRVRSRWNDLYESDPTASIFLSWEWMIASVSIERNPWMVLGARDGDSYVAFLPLRFGRFPSRGPAITRELSLGLSPRVDFAGMLGLEELDAGVLPALGREIERLEWDQLIFKNCADARIARLANDFVSGGYRLSIAEPTPCPYVQLPSSWEEYLATRGRSTRRTIRARIGKLKSLPGYRLHLACLEEAESAIDGLLRLRALRWKDGSGESQSVSRELLKRCYLSGRFQIFAMYHGDTLMAAQGFFTDRRRRAILGYMIAYDPDYARYSPGMMLACASIRCAIREGYERFSLSLGAQSYKVSLATNIEYLTNTIISRRNTRVAVADAGRRAGSCAKRIARRLLVRSGS
ncbi:MAG: GNAT family N-acetyltransferase [Candidatus Eremiobacteraeota bacterium]|nr:GNAT family N-acetyltransferase [Candidatus Eremiobacteraeota bacterium]